jgi:NADPH:quinone reductase-like Zn-dependent oxidoreductase
MRAAVHTRYGPPDVVRIAEVDKPSPAGDQVLVKVHATTVNRTDCGFRGAKPFFIRLFSGMAKPRRQVLGGEFAGEIEAVGDGVTSYRVGDRVFGWSEFGAHAEYLVISEKGALATMPAGWSYEQVAPGTEGAQYARNTVVGSGVKRGDDVLVNGATGAIGSAAVQLLRHAGVRVTAVCATPHLDLVKSLGADRVIDYTAVDFTADEQRYDAVFDSVGKSTFGRCRRLLKPGGAYLSSDLGPYGQNPFLVPLTRLFRGKRVLFPLPRPDPNMPAFFRDLMSAGEFTPLVDRRYPLEEIVEAYRYVETGQKVGSVVIVVEPSR